jgi:hypothetical protein
LPLTYVVLRSLLLGTLGNPETRYTLECYPCIILMAAALWFKPAHHSLTCSHPDVEQHKSV